MTNCHCDEVVFEYIFVYVCGGGIQPQAVLTRNHATHSLVSKCPIGHSKPHSARHDPCVLNACCFPPFARRSSNTCTRTWPKNDQRRRGRLARDYTFFKSCMSWGPSIHAFALPVRSFRSALTGIRSLTPCSTTLAHVKALPTAWQHAQSKNCSGIKNCTKV